MNGGTIRDFNGELVTALNLTPGGDLLIFEKSKSINLASQL
jgi:hypothetical protein